MMPLAAPRMVDGRPADWALSGHGAITVGGAARESAGPSAPAPGAASFFGRRPAATSFAPETRRDPPYRSPLPSADNPRDTDRAVVDAAPKAAAVSAASANASRGPTPRNAAHPSAAAVP